MAPFSTQRVRAWLAGWFARRKCRPSPRRRRLEMEVLEDRINPAPNPVISIAAPATPFIGAGTGTTAPVPLSITFQNTGTAPGYAPWDYAVLPNVAPTDGDVGEGLSFDAAVTPTFLGSPVTFQEFTVPGSGQLTGPSFALQGTSGNPIVLTGLTPGDQVVFFQLPFGSFAANQPGATINFAGIVSNEATINQPLTLTAGGGFSFGADPLNDPSTDPPIVAATTTAATTPSLFTVTKTYLGPENETATGPNFPEQFRINVSVAPGQTLTNFSITDFLPSTEQWLGAAGVTASANGGTFTGLDPIRTTATTTQPGGNIVADFNQVVGTGGPADATMTFSFYVPENDASGNPVLPLNTGAFQNLTNTATAAGTYTSLDTSDNPNGPVSNSSNPATATITAKSIAVQKSVAVVGGGAVAQGAVLQYTINFQVSDYFAFNQLNIGDLLPDGVRFDQSFAPTLSIRQHTGNSAAAPFNSANYLSPPPTTFNADGTQTLNFAVSNELISRGDPAGGDLIGGNIPAGGTGGPAPADAFNSPLFGGTTGQIVFRAIVQQQYSVTTSPNGNKDIKQGDSFTNVVPNATGTDVAIQPGGQVLNYANLTGTGTFQADNSSATASVATGLFSKTVYAINGAVVGPTGPYLVQAGDTVTYRLDYLLPTSTAEKFAMTDYLPLPVFNATTVTTFDGTNATNTVAPAVGVADFGPGVANPPSGLTVPARTVNYTTVFPNPANDPTLSSNSGTNTVTFTFPKDLEDTQQRESLVDVLFSVKVLDQPFGDGLALTNQANAVEGNTNANVTSNNAIQQVVLTQPNLNVTKGVVSTNDTGGVFSPTTVGPVPFTAPGVSGAAFTGTINSPGLTANPVNSNLSNLHAGDLVKFAIVLQNTGEGVNGAFNVEFKDTLPAGFVIPTNATGLNLQVVNGAGTVLPFTKVNAGDTNPLFQNGIELTDPSATQGALAPGKDMSGKVVTTGANLAVVTYDLQVEPNNSAADAVHPAEQLTNTATLFNYAAIPGGVDYLSQPLTDPATATIANPNNTKSLVATSEPSTTGNNVVIGEIARFHLVVQLPPGVAPGFQIVDQLPTGLSYLGNTTVALVSQNGKSELSSSTLTTGSVYVAGTSSNITPTAALPAGDIATTGADGAAVTFSLGNLTNNDTTDTTNATPEFVVLEFNALVDNVSHNVAGVTDNNNFIDEINTGGGPAQVGSASNNVGVTIVEPHITTAKTISPTVGDNGDAVTYTITYTSTGGNDAFIAAMTDPSFPASNIIAASLTVTSTGGVVGLVNSSTLVGGVPTVNVTAADMPVGSSVTVTINGTVKNAVVGQSIINTADATWSSLPGGVGTPTGANNTTGQTTPGGDGAANGARDGAGGVNNYASSGTATMSIQNPILTKSLVATSEPSTTGSNVAIGEIARYSLVARMPEAVSPSFQIVDNLPAGLSFLGNAKVAFVSPNGAELSSSDPAISGLPGLSVTGSSGNVTASATVPTSHISGGTGDGVAVTFSLGSITNNDTSAAENDFVVIQFNALVDNVASNTTGVTDTNTFITEVNGAQAGNTSNGVGVTIVEPHISTVKSVTTSTGTIVVENGDTVTYTISYTNTGNNDAFIPLLTDPSFPSSNITASSLTVASSGGVIGLVNSSTLIGGVPTVNVTAADMPVGSSVTVTINGTVKNAAVNQLILNTADATWSSLPGGVGTPTGPTNTTGQVTPGADGAANGARDGDTSASGGAANTYNSQGTATLIIKNPIPAKSLVVTSEPSTNDPNVAIGEIARFQLTVRMPEAVSNNFQMMDNLPVGLSFLGNTRVAFVSPNGAELSSSDATINGLVGLNFTGTSPNVTPTALLPSADISGGVGDGAAVTFNFSNITNNDLASADDDFIVIQFNALVDNVAHNTAGVTDTNTFSDQANGAAAPPVADPGFETPNVGTGTFNAFQYTPTGSPWAFTSGAGVAGNGSGFTSGNPNAPQGTQVGFMQDTGSISQSVNLPAGTFTIGFLAAQRGNFQASFQTFHVLVDGNVVGTIQPTGTSYAPYSTNSFTVTAGAHTIAFVGLDPNGGDNTAFIDEVSINPTASVTIVEPKITNTTKTVNSAGRDPGDTVSYAVTYANSGNADAFDTRLIDALPSTLTLNTGSIVVKRNGVAIATGFTNNTFGNTVDVALAQVAGTENGSPDSIEIDYTATINTTDPAGTVIPNTANLTYTSLPGPFGTTINPTGQSTPGASGAANGERNGSGGVNSYFGSSSQTITVNSNTLTGFVYQDLNNNGSKDLGEPGIPNATVTLTGHDFLNNTVNIVTTTNASGQYTFAKLLPSDAAGYTITETQPAGFLNGKETPPSGNFTGTIGAGSNVGTTVQYSDVYSGIVIGRESNLVGSNYNFGELPPASLAGFVYVDANNNGTKDAGELGIGNVTVTLTGTNDLGQSINQLVQTSSGGLYNFNNLRPGTYTITESQPSNYAEGKDTIGTPGGNASVQDVFSNIVLNAGVNGANNNFGELPTADLGVFKTDNQTTAVPGTAIQYTITVTNNGPSTVNSFNLTDVVPAAILSPIFSGASSGTFTYNSGTGVGAWTGLTLASGQSVRVTMSGTVDPSATGTLVNTATVGGARDSNGNPISDLNSANNSSTDTDTLTPVANLQITKTDPAGQYTPGASITYTIVVTNNGPSNVTGATIADTMPGAITSDTWSAVYSAGSGGSTGGTGNIDIINANLAVGGTATITLVAQISSSATGNLVNTASVTNPYNNVTTTASDTDTPTGSLAGTVFADNNNDGIENGPDFGIAGALLTLKNANGNIITTTTTNSSGQYDFTGLLAGTYTIVETQPARYVDGKDIAGSLGEIGPHVKNQFTVSIGAGGNGTGYNFAEIPPADPQGFVFQDVNDDGIFEAAPPNNEPGIANVVITMTGTDVQGHAVNIATTTDATGFYQFQTRDPAGDLLLPGTYSITETRPAGFLDGKLQNGSPPAASIVNRTFQNIDLTQRPFFGGDYNFGELLPGSLSGSVYVDGNNNGVRDPGELGVGGATVTLTGTDDQGNTVNVPVVTDANGNYIFEQVRPGTYQLTVTQPASFLPGVTTAGTLGGVAGNDAIFSIPVGFGQNGTNYLFAERGLTASMVSKQFFLSTPPPITDPAGSGVAVVDPPADQGQSGNGPTPNQVFVNSVYLDLLGRPADTGGLQYWAGLLNAGTSPASVVRSIENSAEYRTDEVAALYRHYLNRAPDPGAAAWVNRLAEGTPIEQVAADVIGSPEYFALHGSTNQGFLDAVYQDVLNRSGDAAGENSWLQALAGGISRQAVAMGFLTSTEYRADLVGAYYANYLGRPADSAGLDSWLGALQAGLTDQQVLASILGSAEAFRKWS